MTHVERTTSIVKLNLKNSQIEFKTSMLKSSLCHYSDAYIHVNGTITIPNTATAAAPTNNTDQKQYLNFVLDLPIA